MVLCRNVNTYIQTQPKQKLFEVGFKADSTAIVFWFFVAALTHTYKLKSVAILAGRGMGSLTPGQNSRQRNREVPFIL